MLKSRKHGMHFSAAMRLTAACLAIALVAPLGAFAKDGDGDRDDGSEAEMSRPDQRGER